MRIALVTDAWKPQSNGVIRAVESLLDQLHRASHEIALITPEGYRALPCPAYPEIRLAVMPGRSVARRLDAFAPGAVHVATEGPLGLAARRHCLRRGWPFTTSFHSKFPEYIQLRTGQPLVWLYVGARLLHRPAAAMPVPAPSVYRELTARGFASAVTWSHGVDTGVFRPCADTPPGLEALPRPVHGYVGHLAVEKNLPALLALDLPGSKPVVGSGPAREAPMRQFPEAHFRTARGDAELARYFSAVDVFVFPSLTDTLGLVMLEALACGTPVAAFPVTGPLDGIGGSAAGALDDDLAATAARALPIPSGRCRAHAERFSWRTVADQFVASLAPISPASASRPSNARSAAGSW